MIDFRPVLALVGLILCLLAAAMLLPAGLDAATGHEEWQVFAATSGVTLFAGLLLLLANRCERHTPFNTRQIYLATVLGWVLPAIFAAMPFAFGPLALSGVDALFEAISGITTTGATVISGLDRQPPGILLWRGLLQWLGGLGIIAMAMTVLPALRVGGMQMFRVEVLAPTDKVTPRAARVGPSVVAIYIAMTCGLAVLLWVAGMGGFDALVYAMSTIATGGAANHDASLGYFNNGLIEAIICCGMVISGMPFMLLLQVRRGNWRAPLRDQQVHWYLGLLLISIFAITLWLIFEQNFTFLAAFRHGAITVISVMTGTGFATIDYSHWLGFPAAILFFLTFVGGCAGSTAAGIKVFRFHFLLADTLRQIRQLIHPHAMQVPSLNKVPIPKDVMTSAMGFLFVYALAFVVLALLLSLLGLDFVSALSAAASAISNVGPGLGPVIGTGTTFAPLPEAAKILLALGMLLGRLEMFVLLALFAPTFWKQ